MAHRFYIYSNLKGFVPKVKLYSPASVILAGNFGSITDEKTWTNVKTIREQGFTNIFWVPYLTEFSSSNHCHDVRHLGTEFDMRCRDNGVTPLNNEVVTFKGLKIVGSAMLPITYNYYYAAEDAEFMHSEATVDSLIIAGSICPTLKAKYVIHGTPPTGENFCVSNEDQMHITNSRDAIGFHERFYVDIKCCNSGHCRCLNNINCFSSQSDLE